MRRFLLAFVVLVATGGAACVSRLEIPAPPMQEETQAIAAIYDLPTGSFGLGNAQSTLSSVSAAVPALALDWLPNYASGLLTALEDRIKSSGLPDNPDATVETHYFILSAVIALNRVCLGWDNPPGPPDAATNGSIALTAVVENGRLHPESWGTATGCKLNLMALNGATMGNATINGTLILYLLGPLPGSDSQARFLFTFDGTLAVDNQTLSTSIDFRVFDGLLAFRLPVSDGDIIVELGTGSSVTLRASNGTFRCDFSALSCQ
jgi:hypothetical protein